MRDEQLNIQNYSEYVLTVCVCVERTGWSMQMLRATCAQIDNVREYSVIESFISIYPVIRTVTPSAL